MHAIRGRQAIRVARLVALALVAGFGAATSAQAGGGWIEAGDGAVAILPQPADAEGIVGASLSCKEQSWTLLLRADHDWRNQLRKGNVPEPEPEPVLTGAAEIGIGKTRFSVPAQRNDGAIAIALPYEALASIRSGNSLSVRIEGAAGPAQARFSLAGSRRVLDAVEPRCTPPNMDGYRLVEVTQTDPAIRSARKLRSADIDVFRLATASEPRLEANIVTLPDGKGMLFTRLCGSSWYFGRSGCNVTGFVRENLLDDWQLAYDNEGSITYLDIESATGGWPGLLAMPLKGRPELSVWRWNGEAYAPDPGLIALETIAATTSR